MTITVTIPEIEAAAQAALRAFGAGAWQAQEVARAVARAEATGNIICGLYYLESYCIQLKSGRVDGTVEPQVTAPRPGVVHSNAQHGFAQPAFARALPQAVAAARTNGIACLMVAQSHTCTSVGFFTEQIAAEGLIGIGMTNASAIVSGPGGKTPVLGTNPIAITLPGPDAPRMHADFSTAAVALGKITMAKAAGEPIPLGWALNAEGQPTTDPEAALQGSLVSAASYKGWALGLLVEALAVGLTGSVSSLNVKGLKAADGPPHRLGQTYLLIDPGVSEGWEARIETLLSEAAQDPHVRIPGAPRRETTTVAVAPELWTRVTALATGAPSAP